MNRVGVVGLMLGALVLAGGCGDDDEPGHHGGELAASCQDIVDACHEVDPGAGPITECHDTAHDDGTAAACDPIRDMCVAMCEALQGDGGTSNVDGGESDADMQEDTDAGMQADTDAGSQGDTDAG